LPVRVLQHSHGAEVKKGFTTYKTGILYPCVEVFVNSLFSLRNRAGRRREFYFMANHELGAVFGNCKSFYGKARVETTSWGKVLISYTTRVAEIIDGKAVVYGTHSKTTLRHIREFLLQNGFAAEGKAQIERDYMTGEAQSL